MKFIRPLIVFLLALPAIAGTAPSADPLPASESVARARILAGVHRLAEAGEVLESALLAVPRRSEASVVLNRELGWVYHQQGRLNDARLAIHEALNGAEVHEAPVELRVRLLNSLSRVYLDLRDPDRARELNEQAAVELQRSGGGNGVLLAVTLNNRAEIYRRSGALDAAAETYFEALSHLRRESASHGSLEATTVNNLATLYADTGNFRASLESYRQAVALWKELRGENDPLYAQGLANMATVYTELGRYAEARQCYTQALTVLETTLGEDHVRVGNLLGNYAYLLRKSGEDRQAGRMESRARKILIRHRQENLLNHTVGLNDLKTR